jgi:HK97 gp10 family phage protein
MAKRLSDREYQEIMNSPDVQRVLDQQAEAIRDEAKRRAKRVTGETADSIVVEHVLRDDGVQVRRVGYDLDIAESGPYYEFGTEDTAPHPTLRTAARVVRRSR